MKMIKDKLSSSGGETFAETLVAALLGGISILMVVTMIVTATNIVRSSEKKMNEFYQGVSETEKMEATTQGSLRAQIYHSSNYTTPDTVTPESTSDIKIRIYDNPDAGLKAYSQ